MKSFEEWLKSAEKKTEEKSEKPTSGLASFDDWFFSRSGMTTEQWDYEHKKTVAIDSLSGILTSMESVYNDAYDAYDERYKNGVYNQYGTTKSYADDFSKKWTQFKDLEKQLKNPENGYSKYIDPDQWGEIENFVNDAGKNFGLMAEESEKEIEYFSQWSTEEEWRKEYEAANYNLYLGYQELDALYKKIVRATDKGDLKKIVELNNEKTNLENQILYAEEFQSQMSAEETDRKYENQYRNYAIWEIKDKIHSLEDGKEKYWLQDYLAVRKAQEAGLDQSDPLYQEKYYQLYLETLLELGEDRYIDATDRAMIEAQDVKQEYYDFANSTPEELGISPGEMLLKSQFLLRRQQGKHNAKKGEILSAQSAYVNIHDSLLDVKAEITLKEMSDQERKWYEDGDADSLLAAGYTEQQLLDLVEYQKRQNNAKTMQKISDWWTGFSKNHPIISGASSVITNFVAAATDPLTAIDDFFDKSSYMVGDPNKLGYVPGKLAQISRQELSSWAKEISPALDVITKIGLSTTDNMLRIGVAGSVGSLVLAGTGSFGSTYRSVVERGGTKEQAAYMGMITAALEVGTEKLSLDNLLSLKDQGSRKGFLRAFLSQGVAEVSEEELNFLGSLIAEASIMADKSEYNLRVQELVASGMSEEDAKDKATREVLMDFAETSVVAFGSGGIQGSVQNVVENRRQNLATGNRILKRGENISGGEGGVAALKSLAGSIKDSTTGKVQKRLNKQISRVSEDTKTGFLSGVRNNRNARNIGKLFNTTVSAINSQTEAQMRDNLVASGLTEKAAEKMAHSLVSAVASGELVSEAHMDLFKQMAKDARIVKAVQKTFGEGVTLENTQKVKEFNQRLHKSKYTTTEQLSKEAKDAGYKISENGYSIRGAKIVDTKDGITVEMDGKQAKVQSMNLQEGDAIALKAIADTGVSAESANKLLSTYNSTAISGTEFAQQVSIGFELGYAGFNEGGLSNNLGRVSPISRQAYEMGKDFRAQEEKSGNRTKTTTEAALWSLDAEGRANRLESVEDVEKLAKDDRRSVAVMTARLLQRSRVVGGNVFFFESYDSVKQDGKNYRKFRDKNGLDQLAPNGIYYSNGDIYIDLNAGMDADGYALATFAHELTHMIQQWSPEKYRVMGDFLAEQYEKKGVSAYAAVKATQKRLSDLRGQQVSYTEAYHEWMAESMSTLFNDGKLYDKLVALKNKDKGLFNFLKRQFDKLAKRVHKAYADFVAETPEARFVQNLSTDAIDRLQQIFADALVKAGDTYARAEKTKNTTDEGGVQMQDKSRRKYDFSKPFAQQVDDYKMGLFPKGDTLLLGGTPSVYQSLGFNALPMTIDTTHVDYALNGTKDADHFMGEAALKQLPKSLENPIAVFVSQTHETTSVIALLNFTINGKQTVAPIVIDGYGKNNQIVIDSNAVSSAYGKTSAIKQLYQAAQNEAKGKFALLYANKKEAISLLHRTGYQLTGTLIPHDGFYHSIRESNSPVKPKFENVTETQQFKSWFGDWQKHPKTASKIVNADGTPKVMYHGTNAQFTVFDKRRARMGVFGRGFYFAPTRSRAGMYGSATILETYLNIRTPYIVHDSMGFTSEDYRDMQKAFGLQEKITDHNVARILQNQGYDGIIAEDGNGNVKEVVAFEPTQIKSATDNIGTFDGTNPDIRYSDRQRRGVDTEAPTFYSQMAKVVEGMKQEKFGAASVVNMLRGKGVKAEEIKWSGIEAWLEGKKSVTKQELQEFIAGSMLQIQEQESGTDKKAYKKLNKLWKKYAKADLSKDFSKYYAITPEHLEDTFGVLATTRGIRLSEDVKDQMRAIAREAGNDGRWAEYVVPGGENYREIVFRLPDSTYTNEAMQNHWGTDAQGILAHARIQDIHVNGKKMLFIEEIQSDWHNAGHKEGYGETVPDAPFRNTYQEFVLKRLIREAAEKGYDSIGWATADIQSQRWLEEYAEGYRIEYDQDIPKFLAKYGKKWGTQPGKTQLADGTEIWTMPVPKAMAQSVITEGQPMYQDRNRPTGEMVADALESVAAPEDMLTVERYREAAENLRQQEKLRDKAQAEIQTMNNAGDRDPEKLRQLRGEAARANARANNYRKKLTELENSIPYKRMTKHLAANGFVVERHTNEENMTVYDYVYRKLVTGTKVADMLDRVATKKDELTVKRYREAYKELAGWEAAYANTMSDIQKAEWRGDPNADRLDRLKAEANKAARMMEQGRKKLQAIESSKPYQRMITELRSQGYNLVRTAREDGVTVYRYSEPATDDNWISEREVERKSPRKKSTEAFYEEREAKLRAEFAKKLESADAYHEERYERREAEYRESREREAERAEKSKLRKKIRRVAEQLRSITEKASKERRTKEVLRPLAESAIRVADLVFLENYNEYNMIRNGVGNALSDKHQDLMDECRSLLEQLDREMERVVADENLSTEIHDRWDPDAAMAKDDRVEAIKKELARKMAVLRNDGVFQAEFKRLNDFNANQLLTEMYNAYEDLATAEDAFINGAYRAEIGYKINAVKKSVGAKAVRDMTISELKQVYELYYAIHHTITTANQAFADGKKLDDVAKETVQEFREAQKEPGKLRRVARAGRNKLGWLYEKPIYALERVGSKTFTRLWKNLFDSENITMQDVREANQYMLQQVEKHGYNKWKVNKKVDKTFSDLGGKEFRLTLGEIMTLYAYQRRGTVFNHIQESGFEIKSKGLTEANPADTYRVSKEMVEHITDLLTAEQKAFVVAMQTYLSDVMGEKGNETSMKMLGLKLFGEKNYFPVKTAGNWMARAAEATAKETKGFAVLKNAGFTKAQNENATTAIALDDFMSVWKDHVWDMSLYHGAVPALEDIRRVMNYSAEGKSVKAALVNSYGDGALKYFDELYRNANGAAVMDRVERPIKKAVSLFRKSAVAYSLSVAIQQPGSIYRAMAMVPKKYFGFHGFGTITKAAGRSVFRKIPGNKFKEIYARMVKYAPGVTLAKEIGGFDVSGRGVSAYLMDTEKSLLEKLKTEKASGKASAVMNLIDDNIIANIPNAMDKLAWVEIWTACENETADLRRDLKKGSEEFYKAVGERFTDVIRTTQVYDSIFAKSPILRSRSMAVQMVTSFMNEANTIANMTESTVRDAARGNWKSAVRKAYFIVQSQVITSALWALVAAMRDDEEDETFVEKFVEHILEKLVDSFNPLEYIPFVRDFYNGLLGDAGNRSDTELLTKVGKAIDKINKLSDKDTEGMSKEQLQQHEDDVQAAQWNLALEVANMFGIPIKNIQRDANAVINFFGTDFVDGTTWESVKQKAEAALFDTPAQESLYNALVSGDEEYIARIRGGYETERDFNNAASKALRAYDPRIRQAAKAELAGNIRERQRIAEEILAEGNFDKNMVASAISSEVTYLEEDEPKKEDFKAKGWYDSDDIYTAVFGGDMELLEEIQQEYISTAEANGKNAEDGVKSFKNTVNAAAKEAFTAGAITADEALDLRMQYSNEDEEEAAETVAWWNFQAENPDYDDLSKSRTITWLEDVKNTGMELEVYYEFCKQYPKLKDEDGKTDKKAIKKLIDEIAEEENLTYKQKKALKNIAGV